MLSTPAFSNPAFSTVAIFPVSHFPLPHFQSPHYVVHSYIYISIFFSIFLPKAARLASCLLVHVLWCQWQWSVKRHLYRLLLGWRPLVPGTDGGLLKATRKLWIYYRDDDDGWKRRRCLDVAVIMHESLCVVVNNVIGSISPHPLATSPLPLKPDYNQHRAG